MLDTVAIAAIIRPIAEGAVSPSRVQTIEVEEIADSFGDEAFQVVVVADAVPFDTVRARADAQVAIQHALQARGSRATPIPASSSRTG